MSQTVLFDPERTWQPIEARIAIESNPQCRALLEEVRDHMRAEIRGELDPLMATLIDEPQYHMWGIGPEAGPKGREAVSLFYKNMIANGGNRFEFAVERIVADLHSVVTEGRMRSVSRGRDLIAGGTEELQGEPVDADAEYMSEWQILTVWPAGEDGKLVGEDIYFGSMPSGEYTKL